MTAGELISRFGEQHVAAFILVNTLVDVVYGALDPRMRRGGPA